MPRIYVDWIKGRSEEQRDLLAERITKEFVEIANVTPEQVFIVFKENDPDMYYKAGLQYDKRK